MVFGWYGFSFDHPDDWSPVVLQGQRQRGYVRLDSGEHAIQMRWDKAPSSGNLPVILQNYLKKLEKDAKKAKRPFQSKTEPEGDQLLYRYSGAVNGRGALFCKGTPPRIFFLEATGPPGTPLVHAFRQILSSLRVHDRDRWALLGLDVTLPGQAMLKSRKLLAGRIRLELEARRTRVVLERWGFAEQLLARFDHIEWARQVLAMPSAKVIQEDYGLRFVQNRSILRRRVEALAFAESERNQIILARVASNVEQWRPQWEWFEGFFGAGPQTPTSIGSLSPSETHL